MLNGPKISFHNFFSKCVNPKFCLSLLQSTNVAPVKFSRRLHENIFLYIFVNKIYFYVALGLLLLLTFNCHIGVLGTDYLTIDQTDHWPREHRPSEPSTELPMEALLPRPPCINNFKLFYFLVKY